MTDDWRTEVEADRRRKEEYFSEHPRSPIPGEAFAGLAFFPVDPDYRLELPLHEHDEKVTVVVETTADGRREYDRWGEFRFEVDDEAVTLQAFRSDPDDDRFWVPFRDGTNGQETYGGGRYIDLEPDDRTAAGDWILDFNRAYNPTCAYNEAYECPLVPMVNWLDVPIEAGEKAYPGDPVEGHHH